MAAGEGKSVFSTGESLGVNHTPGKAHAQEEHKTDSR